MPLSANGQDLGYWAGINPSEGAALTFAALFGFGGLYHLFQLWKFRAWYFIPFTIGGLMMCAGYIARYISIKQQYTLGPYIIQTLFIILPPSLYAATIYMLYGRIVFLVDAADLSLIRPTWVTKVFVAGDAFSFLLQAGGGSLLTSANSATLGKNVLLGGLFFQLASFGFFLVVSGCFYYRVQNSGRPRVQTLGKYHWTRAMQIMYLAAALIIFRCVFRVCEFQSSATSPVRKNEIYSYCLDAVPMLGVQTLFNVYHGGMVIPSPGAQKKALGGEGSEYELTRGEV